jgi:TolB-like protein
MPNANQTSGLSQFLAEMRRRHVVRFAFGYAAAAFVVLQLAEIVFPAFGISEGGLRLLVVVTGLGFLPAIVLAWMYDLTTEGIQRTGGGFENPILPRLALGALLIMSFGVAGALGLYLARQGVFETPVADGPFTAPPVQLAQYDPDAPIRSIAVLPLDDNSPEGDQGYFTASMHEELIAKLSGLEDVRVVSRTSVMQYEGTTMTMPEISRQLDADVIIEGSVARTPSRTRVTLQLIHAPSDSHIQTLQWDRESVEDILAFQDEIAHDVVHEVSVQYDEATFVQTATNVDPEAQDAFFRGRYEYDRGTEDGYRMAFEYFEDALEADPDFAPAMAGIAGARFMIELDDDEVSEVEVARAHEEAMAALALDSGSVEAREVLSLIERSMPQMLGTTAMIPAPESAPRTVRVMTMPEHDSIVIDVGAFDTTWVSAVTSIGERIEAKVRQLNMPEGTSRAERAAMEARQLMYTGRYAEAVRMLERVVEESPNVDPGWDMLARSHVMVGEPLDAADVIQRWNEAGVGGAPSDEQVNALRARIGEDGIAGYWAWHLERLEDLRDEGRPVPNMEIATAHAALGDHDQALEYLIDALEAGEPGVFSIRSDPVWDELRSDPRLREIGRQAQTMRLNPRRRPPRR